MLLNGQNERYFDCQWLTYAITTSSFPVAKNKLSISFLLQGNCFLQEEEEGKKSNYN